MKGRAWVWTGIAYFAVWNLAVAPMFVLGPFVAGESLGGASSWGAIVTCAGVGSLVGAAAALRLKPRRPLATGFLLFGLVAVEPALLARPFPTAVVAAAAAIGFAGSAFGNALWFTTLQERIPERSISRVSAYDWLGSIVFKPAGYAFVGALVAALGTRSTLLACAGVIAVASVLVLLAQRRARRRPPGGNPRGRRRPFSELTRGLRPRSRGRPLSTVGCDPTTSGRSSRGPASRASISG